MTVQRVVVVRTGGFAGIRRQAEIDDPDRAAAFAAAMPDSSAAAPARPDGFEYRITVVGTEGTRTTELPESALEGDLRAAVRALFSR